MGKRRNSGDKTIWRNPTGRDHALRQAHISNSHEVADRQHASGGAPQAQRRPIHERPRGVSERTEGQGSKPFLRQRFRPDGIGFYLLGGTSRDIEKQVVACCVGVEYLGETYHIIRYNKLHIALLSRCHSPEDLTGKRRQTRRRCVWRPALSQRRATERYSIIGKTTRVIGGS